MPDWYYQRQLTRVADPQAPEGEHFLLFQNQEPGKPGMAMQGFPVDGRQIVRLEVAAWVKYDDVRRGRTNDELPAIVVTFYDENRVPLGNRWIGPFQGICGLAREDRDHPSPSRGARKPSCGSVCSAPSARSASTTSASKASRDDRCWPHC